MSSRVSLLAACALLLCALAVGYWGLKLGHRAAPETAVDIQVEEAPLASGLSDLQDASVVILLRDIPLYGQISAEDVAMQKVPVAPPGSFSRVDQVVGKTLQMPVAAGSWLSEDAFSSGGKLAHLISPDERAVAINVDEIIAAGGHLRPGDYVDVLLHMNQPSEQGRTQESAQVVLQALRVLSFGKALVPQSEQLAVPPEADKEPPSAGRSVVLAVPSALVNRLLLASQAGTLRLAVRSADEQLAALPAEQAQALAAQASPLLLLRNLTGPSSTGPSIQQPVAAPAAPRPAPRARSVEVIRGTQSSQQNP